MLIKYIKLCIDALIGCSVFSMDGRQKVAT